MIAPQNHARSVRNKGDGSELAKQPEYRLFTLFQVNSHLAKARAILVQLKLFAPRPAKQCVVDITGFLTN